jgi:tRNA-dihydrouridine synthase
MALSSKIVTTVRPDIVDINFGCPVKKVVCKGAGAGVLKDVDLMIRLTKAVINSTDLPVTVKTRLGWDDNSINMRCGRGFKISEAALSIHARTRAQMYKGHSDWSHIARVKNNPRITMPILVTEILTALKSIKI